MNPPSPVLFTDRLELRQAVAADAGPIRSYRARPEVARYQSWSGFDADDARNLVAGQAGLAPDVAGSWFQLVLVERASAALVGDLALHFRADDTRQVEIGINLAPAAQGRGYAGEAIGRVLGYVFDDLGKHRVVAVTDADNAAAARLMRRTGFRQEAHLVENVWFKGRYGSEFVFAMLASEWRARKR